MRRILAAILLAGLAFVAPAEASRVTSGLVSYEEDWEAYYQYVEVTAARGERNGIDVRIDRRGLVVGDLAGIAAGRGCRRIRSTAAVCPLLGDAAQIEMGVTAGDRDDDVRIGRSVPGDIFVYGGAGDDTIRTSGRRGAAQFVVEGGSGDDRLRGGSEVEWLSGGSGRDDLAGGAGNDHLDDGEGSDRVSGGTGRDTLNYSAWEHRRGVTVDLAAGRAGRARERDRLESIEVVVGTEHPDILRGSAEADEINGWEGEDVIEGRAGNDRLAGVACADMPPFLGTAGQGGVCGGRQGRDRVLAGPGDDTVTDAEDVDCGPGADVARTVELQLAGASGKPMWLNACERWSFGSSWLVPQARLEPGALVLDASPTTVDLAVLEPEGRVTLAEGTVSGAASRLPLTDAGLEWLASHPRPTHLLIDRVGPVTIPPLPGLQVAFVLE